jgi:hypothetical protein
MDNQKQQVVERLQQANNILVTVSNNPSVDQLSACIGLTLALNKMGKHATAVFSGQIPSTIEFLQPEHTIEKNTDSLRDFIIALDKSKADKLRYKVEDRMVKIFITPYRTSISDKDLDFSQGDFNVDVVLALGVHAQVELDQAITSHGRILHDATVMSINTKPGAELGSVNWIDAGVSSLSELSVQIIDNLDKNLMDGQIATAFLTGIVAETERFSNNKTSPQTMSISAELMSAGANQQLVATKLEEPVVVPEPPKPIAEKPEPLPKDAPAVPAEEPPKPNNDGTIEIEHDKTTDLTPVAPVPPALSGPQEQQEESLPELSTPEVEEVPDAPQIHIDDQGHLHPFGPPKPDENAALPKIEPLPTIRRDREEGSKLLTEPEPPMFSNSPLTANTEAEDEDEPSADPLSLPSVGLLNREPLPSQQPEAAKTFAGVQSPSMMPPANPVMPQSPVVIPPPQQPIMPEGSVIASPGVTPLNPSTGAPAFGKTLSEIEQDVRSPHLEPAVSPAVMPPAPQVVQPMTPPAPTVVVPESTPSSNANDHGAASLDDARSAVEQAINGAVSDNPGPVQALNAQPLGEISHDAPVTTMPAPQVTQPQQPVSFEAPAPEENTNSMATPPPVPPPMMPPTFPPQQ